MANKCEAYGGGYCDNEYVVSVRGYLLCKRCATMSAQHHSSSSFMPPEFEIIEDPDCPPSMMYFVKRDQYFVGRVKMDMEKLIKQLLDLHDTFKALSPEEIDELGEAWDITHRGDIVSSFGYLLDYQGFTLFELADILIDWTVDAS